MISKRQKWACILMNKQNAVVSSVFGLLTNWRPDNINRISILFIDNDHYVKHFGIIFDVAFIVSLPNLKSQSAKCNSTNSQQLSDANLYSMWTNFFHVQFSLDFVYDFCHVLREGLCSIREQCLFFCIDNQESNRQLL